jgi:hypothetical protein
MGPTWNLVYYAVVTTVLLTAIHAIVARPARPGRVRLIALGGFLFALGWTWVTWRLPYDFKRFWWVGHNLAGGVDRYGIDPWGEHDPILNPPTALPLFRLFAVVSLRTSAHVWTILNALGVLALVPLAQAVLRDRMGPDAPRLPRFRLAIVTAALALSCSHGMGLALGQVSLLTTVAILAALHAQGRGRPGLAGFCLAVATIKVNTMLPFLVLFLRRRDRRTWLSLAACCLAFCLATGPLSALPGRCIASLATIRGSFEPGHVNDYAYDGPAQSSLVGIDHALYRLGLRDRVLIQRVQIALLAGLGLALAHRVVRDRLRRDHACALVALYATLFLYHRVYDLVLLVLPLVFALLRAEETPGPSRRPLSCAGVLLLLALYVNPDGLRQLSASALELGRAGLLVQAALLPIAAWLVLASLALLGRDPGTAPRPEQAAPSAHLRGAGDRNPARHRHAPRVVSHRNENCS